MSIIGATADADHFGNLAIRREVRERRRVAFTDRAKRTSVRRRRWFQISEIEPDPATCERLLGLWRASIYSGDLILNGRSQVLCLSATPLLSDYRCPPDLARGEHFNGIARDLWMSVPRWLEWFRDVGHAPPPWFTTLCGTVLVNGKPLVAAADDSTGRKSWKEKVGSRHRLTKLETPVVRVVNELWPEGIIDERAGIRNRKINERLRSKVTSRTIQRALSKVHFV